MYKVLSGDNAILRVSVKSDDFKIISALKLKSEKWTSFFRCLLLIHMTL